MLDLITENIDVWSSAQTPKINGGRGRSKSGGHTVYGINKLRELILTLAMKGKLVPKDPKDEPASELLKKITEEKKRLVTERKIKNDKPLTEITEEEKIYPLPQGWEWVKLGSVIYFVNGYAFSSTDFSDSGIGIVKIGDISEGKINPTTMSRVAPKIIESLDSNLQVRNGDMLIAMSGATTGKLGFNESQDVYYFNQRVGKIVPIKVSIRFLYIDLTLKISENLRKSAGSAIPNLSTEQIKNIVLALPPLAEQLRIVAKVDELMALCDQLETQHTNAAEAHEKLVSYLLGTLTQSQSATDFSTNWQRIATHFDILFTTEPSINQLKQTLLQLAVMGKLVSQDPKDESASELLRKIQSEKARLIVKGKIKKDKPLPPINNDEKLFELPKGWEWVRLQSVIDVRDGTHDSPKEAEGPDTYPLVTSKDFFAGEINFDTARRISKADHLGIAKRSLVEKYDILFSMIGGNIGNQVMVEVNRPFSIKNVALFKYYDRSLTFPFYIKKYMENLALSLQTVAIGGAQPFVSLGVLRTLVVALPPVSEQRRIVAKLDELMGMCDKLIVHLNEAKTIQINLADAIVDQAVA